MRHFPAPLTRAESDAWIDRMVAHDAEHGFTFWALEHRPSGVLMGAVGLLWLPWPARFAPAVEIGWRLARAFQGRGHAAAAARLALGVGFGRLGLDHIVAFTAVGNAPSRALMGRLGMRIAGGFAHPRVPEGHPLRAHLLYRLDRPCHGPAPDPTSPA